MYFYGLHRWQSGKESSCQCRRCKRLGFDHWVRKIPGVGNGNVLQYSCLENPIDRGVSRVTVHGVAKSRTRLRMQTCNVYISIAIFVRKIQRKKEMELVYIIREDCEEDEK